MAAFVFFFSINASVTSSSEAIKSKTIIQMENEKLYLMLNLFSTKKVFTIFFYLCLCFFVSYNPSLISVMFTFLIFSLDSYYGGHEGHGNGEWSRSNTNAWKRSSIWRPSYAISWGKNPQLRDEFLTGMFNVWNTSNSYWWEIMRKSFATLLDHLACQRDAQIF